MKNFKERKKKIPLNSKKRNEKYFIQFFFKILKKKLHDLNLYILYSNINLKLWQNDEKNG